MRKNKLLVCLLITFSFAQELNQISGKITYVTTQSFYCDVGRNSGLNVGDSLFVYDNNIQIGYSIISNLSSTSSVCELIPNVDVRKGNIVKSYILVEVVDSVKTEDSSSQAISKDDNEVKPLKRNLTGTFSCRYNQNVIDNFIQDNRLNGLFNFQFQSILGLPIQVSMYGKTNDMINDTTISTSIHQLSFKFVDKSKQWDISAGRVYSPGLIGAGSVDGINISRKFNNNRVGIIGGYEDSEKQTKYGIFSNFSGVNKYIKYINISETFVSDSIKIIFSNISTRIRPIKNVNISINTRYNIPNSNGTNSYLSLANVYTDIRLFKWLRTSTYYNYGESNVTIDSTINKLTREFFGENIFVKLPNKIRCNFSYTKLLLKNNQNSINNFSIRLSKDNFIFKNVSGKLTFDVLKSILYNSSKGRIGFIYSTKNWNTSLNISREMYYYGIDGDNYQKQNINLEFFKKWLNSLSTSFYVDFSNGDEGEAIYGSFQISYRLNSF